MEDFKCCFNFTAFLMIIICLLVGVKSYEGNFINNSYHKTGRGAQGGNKVEDGKGTALSSHLAE